MKKIIPLIFLIFTASCAAFSDAVFPDFPSANSFVNRFPRNKKGIVILQLNSDYATATWCKSDLINKPESKNCITMKPSNSYQIFMLQPGWYELSGYESVSASMTRIQIREHNIEPEISNITHKRRGKPLIAFKVTQEKISYIGQIKLHDGNSSNSVIDDFKTVKTAFEKHNYKDNFKNYLTEAAFIDDYIKNLPNILIKDLAKTRSDFSEEKKVAAIKIKEAKKQEKTQLKKLKLLKQTTQSHEN